MAKTEEELKALKDRVAALSEELSELSEEELSQVAGGTIDNNDVWPPWFWENGRKPRLVDIALT